MIAVEGAIIVESGFHRDFDELWVTLLDKQNAVERIMQRNPHIDESQALERVGSQISDEERVQHASFSYDTVAPFEENM